MEVDIRRFVTNVNAGHFDQWNISKARNGYYGAQALFPVLAESNPFNFKIQSISPAKIDGDSATVTVVYQLEPKIDGEGKVKDEKLMNLPPREWSESLTFARGQTYFNPQYINPKIRAWEIVAPEKEPFIVTERRGAPLLSHFAFVLAQKPILNAEFVPHASLARLKELSFGMQQFVQDHDDQFALKASYFYDAVSPYVEKTVFFVPGTYETYAFNDRLTGQCLIDLGNGIVKMTESGQVYLRNAGKTVLLYDGRNEELNFRHDGKAVICLANFEVKLVTREEAKDLIWIPQAR
ncbi:hypothetical protein EON80_04105 [bacterium]|nr:MAG: hypothetical protein EON80_04105 [bacterium]